MEFPEGHLTCYSPLSNKDGSVTGKPIAYYSRGLVREHDDPTYKAIPCWEASDTVDADDCPAPPSPTPCSPDPQREPSELFTAPSPFVSAAGSPQEPRPQMPVRSSELADSPPNLPEEAYSDSPRPDPHTMPQRGPATGQHLPLHIKALVLSIRVMPQNARGMPMRSQLKRDTTNFTYEGFLRQQKGRHGSSIPASELMDWFGDPRLFTAETWEYLRTQRSTGRYG